MVLDPETGLQFGSVIEKNLVIDASMFANHRIKVRVRNTSGDPAFSLSAFLNQIEAALAQKGYQPVAADDDDFGLLFDVNVVYSGQATSNIAQEIGFLGAAAGGIAGARADGGVDVALGVLTGVTLGTILGSHVTEDTYIAVADVTIGIVDRADAVKETVIQFGANAPERVREPVAQGFSDTIQTGIAVYAGGRNTPQSQIAAAVRERFLRIVSDVI